MRVKPETFKHLIAIDKNGQLIKIPNMVLRKIAPKNTQDKHLSRNSICIICNFRFLEQKGDWSKKIKVFCHPFKNDSIFPKKTKKYLFSESDFCDRLITPINYTMKKWNTTNYDFVYFTLISREGTRSKGLYLLSLINDVASLLNLKGLVVNYATRETAKHKNTIYHYALDKVKKSIPKFKNLTFVNEKFSTEEVCAIMSTVNFVLLPSNADASPRLLVESIVRNKPLIVNSAIYGGWKYINDNNGSFFEAPNIDEWFHTKYRYDYYFDSLSVAIKKVLSINHRSKISQDFYKKYGFLNSSKKLASIINEISGTNYKVVAFKEWTKQIKNIRKKIR